jgi:hypothetical protein
MEQLPQDVLQEIARRVNMRNRMALEATSRTMRAAVRPVTAEITRETRAELCHALKIAFGIRRIMRQFAHDSADSQKRIAFKRALDAYISAAKARGRPGNGAELTSRVEFEQNGTVCYVKNLFVGLVHTGHRFETRVDVEAIINPETIHIVARPQDGISGQSIFIGDGGQGRPAILWMGSWFEGARSVRQLKRQIRRTSRLQVRQDLAYNLHEMQKGQKHKENIALKVISRAIKACATSLHVTTW